MNPEMLLMAKVDGAASAAQLPLLAGKSFTIGKVTTANNGLSSWLFLAPQNGAGISAGSVALKIEGVKQASVLGTLAGQSVTVGQAPMTIGGASKWLVLHPGNGLVAKGLAAPVLGKGLVDSKMIMMQLEGTKQAAQLPLLAGKSFTVINPPMVGNAGKWLFLKPTTGVVGGDIVALKMKQSAAAQTSMLVGKTFTIGSPPIVAGTGNAWKWLVLKPTNGGATAVAAKGFTGAGATQATWWKIGGGVTSSSGGVSNGGAAAVKAALTGAPGKTAAATTMAKGTGAAATTGAVAATGAAAGSSGTIWSGTGLSLGLGLGLGAMGPVILCGAIAVVGYGVYRYRQIRPGAEATA